MNVVIVESPAKAKTINKYLGPDYTVLASYGHVRDLPAKDGSVRPDAGFSMDWEVDPKAKARLKEITDAVRGADHLYLATDPDREGEAISWHVCEVLGGRKALEGVDVKRVVFNAITKAAIVDAFANPRDAESGADRRLSRPPRAGLSRRLHAVAGAVAQAARQPLGRSRPVRRPASDLRPRDRDRGFPLAGILERQGRVPHRARRDLRSRPDPPRRAQARQDGVRPTRPTPRPRCTRSRRATYAVAKVERKQTRRHPAPPFITSTLQQEARASSACRRRRPCGWRRSCTRASPSAPRPSA